MGRPTEQPGRTRNATVLQTLLPWLIFAMLAGGTAAIFVVPAQRAEARRQSLARENQSLGLPSDYPLDRAPLFSGAKVLSCNKSKASSKEGDPMDQWDLSAESDASAKDISEFYKSFCSDRDMLQTQMISIPTGFAMDYANENEVIHLEIERRTGAEKTSLKITYYVLARD